ncbi:MAG TPA: hypothetical protein VFW45_14015 [Candidatus Polarisedimenticolia bacterium]|nr:hypothetical protein [Candidatus Polarisedimenticolia bacterium]
MLTNWTGIEVLIEAPRCSPIIRYALLAYTFLSLLMAAPVPAFG